MFELTPEQQAAHEAFQRLYRNVQNEMRGSSSFDVACLGANLLVDAFIQMGKTPDEAVHFLRDVWVMFYV